MGALDAHVCQTKPHVAVRTLGVRGFGGDMTGQLPARGGRISMVAGQA